MLLICIILCNVYLGCFVSGLSAFCLLGFYFSPGFWPFVYLDFITLLGFVLLFTWVLLLSWVFFYCLDILSVYQWYLFVKFYVYLMKFSITEKPAKNENGQIKKIYTLHVFTPKCPKITMKATSIYIFTQVLTYVINMCIKILKS